MKVWALADLHLSFTRPVDPHDWSTAAEHKPMGCFGSGWQNHYQTIYHHWQQSVGDEDIVLVPGDISWALKLKETVYDFQYISELPGRKLLVQGNHDYWWQSIGKVRHVLPDDTFALQNDSIAFPGLTIAGTRGWLCPNDRQFTAHDEKIYKREILRLEMSLHSIKKRQQHLLVMFHYMPANDKHEKNEMIELLQAFGVKTCVYGHLHGGDAHRIRLPDEKWGINFHLVSADYLKFTPKLILS